MARKTLGWLAVLLTSATLGVAQPSGDYGFSFDASDAPIWDFTGTYGDELTSVAIDHDNKGNLRGSGSALVRVGIDVVAATYNVSGKVSGSGYDTRAKFTVRLRGQDYIAGDFRKFNITMTYDLSLVPGELLLVGTVKGNASYSGLGSSKIDEQVEFPMPTGADGSWAVVMNLLLLDKKLAGTGVILVSTVKSPDLPIGWPEERILPADVRGNYNERTGISRVNVKGVAEGKGASLKIEFYPDDLYPISVRGKVLGQRVNIESGLE